MIKQNINKIHYDITNEFEVVTISEQFNKDLGSYIEISITEGKKEVKLTLDRLFLFYLSKFLSFFYSDLTFSNNTK